MAEQSEDEERSAKKARIAKWFKAFLIVLGIAQYGWIFFPVLAPLANIADLVFIFGMWGFVFAYVLTYPKGEGKSKVSQTYRRSAKADVTEFPTIKIARKVPKPPPSKKTKGHPGEKHPYTQDIGMFRLTAIGLVIMLLGTLFNKQLLDVTEDNAHRQLRAYISVSLNSLRCTRCDRPLQKDSDIDQDILSTVNMKVENSGQTPASHVHVCANWKIASYLEPLPEDFPYTCGDTNGVNNSDNRTESFIAPSKSRLVEFPVFSDAITMARKKYITLYGYGSVTFVDDYGKARKMPFCFIYNPVAGKDGFIACEGHNNPEDD